MNQIIINFFLFISIVITHKYYVSSTLIDYNSKSGNFEISLKIFYDDIEKELGFDFNQMDFSKYDETNIIIKTYLEDNFSIYSDDVVVDLDFIGYEKKRDLVIYYIELLNHKKLKSFTIQNRILFNSFRNQKNIILFRFNNFKKSFIHTPKDFESIITIP